MYLISLYIKTLIYCVRKQRTSFSKMHNNLLYLLLNPIKTENWFCYKCYIYSRNNLFAASIKYNIPFSHKDSKSLKSDAEEIYLICRTFPGSLGNHGRLLFSLSNPKLMAMILRPISSLYPKPQRSFIR